MCAVNCLAEIIKLTGAWTPWRVQSGVGGVGRVELVLVDFLLILAFYELSSYSVNCPLSIPNKVE